MYKEIIRKIVLLLTKPEVAWPQFVKEGFSNKQILKQFCYPLMGAASVLKILQEAIFHRHPAYPIHVFSLRNQFEQTRFSRYR